MPTRRTFAGPFSRPCQAAAMAALCVAVLAALSGPASAALVLDDALEGATVGTRSGGAFMTGGWQVTGKDDTIYWHVPTITKGAIEFDVRGLQPHERRPGMEDKSELFHMYDHTAGSADAQYGGYRENPFKHFIRKIGALDAPKVNAMEIVWQVQPHCVEPDTAPTGAPAAASRRGLAPMRTLWPAGIHRPGTDGETRSTPSR